ncbi:unnamed protein product [Polarella glacialis]|uniref:Uncharacterized protein n=1 Tax=Polarella glacialis TaxID=89957 RepID=A0A813HQ67_POLGL|nr:unnamed protein product [Polarella glacialis]
MLHSKIKAPFQDNCITVLVVLPSTLPWNPQSNAAVAVEAPSAGPMLPWQLMRRLPEPAKNPYAGPMLPWQLRRQLPAEIQGPAERYSDAAERKAASGNATRVQRAAAAEGAAVCEASRGDAAAAGGATHSPAVGFGLSCHVAAEAQVEAALPAKW